MDVATEYQHAKAYIHWCMLHPLLRDVVIHIPNEGKRSSHGGYGLKLIGLRPGVSDFFIPVPVDPYHGLWIELKALKGRLTVDQRIWLGRMKDRLYAAYVAYGWDEARSLTEEYLKPLMKTGARYGG